MKPLNILILTATLGLIYVALLSATSLAVLAVMGGFIYIVWLATTTIAKRIVSSPSVRKVVDYETKSSSTRIKLALSKWFTWNIAMDPEKGSAGGNVKINFPVKSGLILGFICLFLSLIIDSIARYIVPGVFLVFAGYHFTQWWRQIALLNKLESTSERVRTSITQKESYKRSISNKIIAGVCSGFSEFVKVPTFVVRALFVAGAIFYGMGIIFYGVIWILIPTEVESDPLIESEESIKKT